MVNKGEGFQPGVKEHTNIQKMFNKNFHINSELIL